MSALLTPALIDAVCGLARTAAEAILEVYRGDFDVEHKDDRSPVTAADLAAHQVIVQGLHALTPDIPVLSEESTHIGWAERSSWLRYWLVDPLDGTREFIKRNGEFTVNIALIEQHQPVFGVVQTPVSGELAWGWQGGGAWLSERDHPAPRRIYTRARAQPLVVAGSRSHGTARLNELMERVGEHVVIGLGSSLKFVRIAAGDADLYLRLGPTSEWDTAAGQCVLEQAGGRVTDLAGNPLRYNTKDSLLNPEFIACGDPAHDWPRVLGTASESV